MRSTSLEIKSEKLLPSPNTTPISLLIQQQQQQQQQHQQRNNNSISSIKQQQQQQQVKGNILLERFYFKKNGKQNFLIYYGISIVLFKTYFGNHD
jgi:hypothetical protein